MYEALRSSVSGKDVPRRRSWRPPRRGLLLLLMLAAGLPRPGQGGNAPPGERYFASGTVRVATVLGYGQPMLVADAPPQVAATQAGGDVVWGADIGLPVTLDLALEEGADPQPVTFFFFGDTDLLDHDVLVNQKRAQPLNVPDGTTVTPYGVIQGDGYAFSLDATPADGLALSHFFRNGEGTLSCPEVGDDGYRAMYVPGVHSGGPCSSAIPVGDDLFWLFLTPTGAWGMDQTLFVVIADQTPYDGVPQASSYLAASTPGSSGADLGLTWTALNGGQPISSPTISDWPTSKFVHMDALPVDAADYQDPDRSGPCKLPLPQGNDTRGFLLFGAGLWTQSDVYLAFVARSELEAAVADPSRPIQISYFKGESTQGCWSTDQADATPVVRAFDDRSYASMEIPCGNHVIQNSIGAGYVSVTRLSGTLGDDTQVDRLVMLYDSGYLVCTSESPDTCCGGTLAEDGVTCIVEDLDTYAQYIKEGSAGVVMVTGDPWRPWIWNVDTEADPAASAAPPDNRLLHPVVIPPDPSANWYGDGPVCEAYRGWDDVLAGYAPLIVDRFSAPSADGTGFDLYFVLSRWGTKVSPDDPGDADDGYHYMVDLFRTTITRRSRMPALREAPVSHRELAAASSH